MKSNFPIPGKEEQDKTIMKVFGSGLVTAYLYTIQLGDHPTSKHLRYKLLLITMSLMTLLMFTFYTSQITAEMTSGPAKIPVRTFEDVIRLGYKVISISEYYVSNLATAPPDSAKYQAFRLHFENGNGLKDSDEVAMEEAISDPGSQFN